MSVTSIIALTLFALVAFIAATMASKGLTARALLPFHQAGTGRSADTLSAAETSVAVALTRSLGLGFAVATLSLVAAALGAVLNDRWLVGGSAGVALAFCAGLAVINQRLEATTSVGTPWKGALYAAIVIAVGVALAMV